MKCFLLPKKGGEGWITVSSTTHSVWSILPWDVPWDLGHVFFLGLTYLVLALLGVTLTVVVLRTRRAIRTPPH
jgi:hypothetical protein